MILKLVRFLLFIYSPAKPVFRYMANVSGLFKIKQICFVKTGRTATISNSHFEYFEIGNLYCLLEYAMLYWNQIPISPDIWSRSVYRQKFVKNRLSDTRYHERLIKIAMSGPAKNFFCPVMMLWEKPCNLRVFIRSHSLSFPL